MIAAGLVIVFIILGVSLAFVASEGGSGSGAGAPTPTEGSGDGAPPAAGDIEAKVSQMSQAIALAEGFFTPGTVPNRAHNPGDLGPGDCGNYCIGTIAAVGSTVCQLIDDQTGWMLLANKLRNAFTGNSNVYSPSMTFQQFAQKYAANWRPWVAIVTNRLGVTPDTVIGDWLSQ